MLDKELLALVAQLAAECSDPYKCAAQVVAAHLEQVKQKLTDAGYPEAAEVL